MCKWDQRLKSRTIFLSLNWLVHFLCTKVYWLKHGHISVLKWVRFERVMNVLKKDWECLYPPDLKDISQFKCHDSCLASDYVRIMFLLKKTAYVRISLQGRSSRAWCISLRVQEPKDVTAFCSLGCCMGMRNHSCELLNYAGCRHTKGLQQEKPQSNLGLTSVVTVHVLMVGDHQVTSCLPLK